MTLKKLPFRSGIVKTDSDYAEPGRYVDGQWVRFVSGSPQKMGGWRPPNGVDPPQISGICRRSLAWRDNKSVDHVGAGTHTKLYEYNNGTVTDITPFRGLNTGTLTNAVSTTTALTAVTIAHTAHGQLVGDWVTLTATTSVGGVLVAGNYVIATVPTADSYTITSPIAATATAGPAGGSLAYTYYRRLLGADPFATVNGSSLVTVTDVQTVTEGDTAVFAGAVAVAGLTISGSYTIVSAPGGGVYVIDAGSNANATTSGGGAVVTIQNELGIGLVDTLTGYGWGAGPYGSGAYGTPRTSSGVVIKLRTWALWAYGEWLLANPRGDTIYVWNPTIGGRAIGLYNAPTQVLSFFVTEERYIVALGKDGDGLKMGWPDQIDPTNWVASLNVTANPSRHVQGGNYFQSGTPVRNQISLLWTDTATFLHQWRPDSLVFTTTKIADNAGLFGPNAYTVLGEVAFWVGDGLFWKYDGSVRNLPADDVLEWFFAHVDRDQREKVYLSTIGTHNELILLYPEIGQPDCNKYMLIKLDDPSGQIVFSPGDISRTAWQDRGLIAYPMAVDTDGNIWVHEVGVDGNGEAIDSYVTAAPIDIEDGEVNFDIFGFYPDIEGQVGDLSVTLLTRDRAQDAPVSDGPYTLDTTGNRVDTRSWARMAGFKLESNVVGGNWRVGVSRVDAQPGGSRRGD